MTGEKALKCRNILIIFNFESEQFQTDLKENETKLKTFKAVQKVNLLLPFLHVSHQVPVM